MANALTQFMSGGKLPDLSDAKTQKHLAEDAGDSSGGGDFEFLSFSGKTGRYALGRNKEEIHDDMYLIDPRMTMRGWACWKNVQVVDRVGWSIFHPEDAVAKADLDDHGPYKDGDGWAAERTFVMFRVKDGKQVVFSTTSKSGNNVFADVNAKIHEQTVQGLPPFPLVTFEVDTFTAKDNKNYKPVFEIEEWVDQLSIEAWVAQELSSDDMVNGKKPKKKRAKKAKK